MNEGAVSTILIVFSGGCLVLESYLLFGRQVLVITYFIGWSMLVVLLCLLLDGLFKKEELEYG